MAQDAPEVAWVEVELLLLGVVVGDCRVVLVVEELALVEELAVVEELPVIEELAVVDESDTPDDVEPPEAEDVLVVA